MDVVVQEFCIFLQSAHRNQVLLVRRDALLILDFGFEILDGITGLSLKDDSLTCQGIHTDLHLCVLAERKRGNYMESRKMVLKNLPAGQQWRNRHGEQT